MGERRMLSPEAMAMRMGAKKSREAGGTTADQRAASVVGKEQYAVDAKKFDADMAQVNAEYAAKPEGVKTLYEEDPTEEMIDETELAAENKADEQEAFADKSVDYLVENGMMSESGKLLVDAQDIYDIQLDGKQWVDEKRLTELRQRVRSRNAPVKRDVYGKARAA